MLTLGISPCPNDTFIFDAWINRKLFSAPPVSCRFDDISTLNECALNRRLDVVKISFYAYGLVRKYYRLLNAGGALGRGCGPLLVAKNAELIREALAAPHITVAVPGRYTTAALLLKLYQPALHNIQVMRYESIMPAVAAGSVDAGVIIHEGRFTFARHGLEMIEDLGLWWETATGHPIPLGCIVARESLGTFAIQEIEHAIRDSLRSARKAPEAVMPFMQRHAQELDPDVIQQHVSLYVNDFTMEYGNAGMAAINCLLTKAEESGLLQREVDAGSKPVP
jgi:1,4-dihydroxy-6-naphthoate synthase